MEVILLERVAKLGQMGEVVRVRDGYARNFLLPSGKALRATAVNRLGARLVGIRTTLSGQIAFLLASVIGAISGILIVPITTLYYDTGFLIGLKGFIAAIIGGLVSYPLTAVAALVVGIIEAFSSFYASNYKEVIVFTLIIPVLVLRSLAAPAVEEEGD